MLRQMEASTIHTLAKRGQSQRSIARLMGVSRNTEAQIVSDAGTSEGQENPDFSGPRGSEPGDIIFYDFNGKGVSGIDHAGVESASQPGSQQPGWFGASVDEHSSATDLHEWWGLYPDMVESMDSIKEEMRTDMYVVNIGG